MLLFLAVNPQVWGWVIQGKVSFALFVPVQQMHVGNTLEHNAGSLNVYDLYAIVSYQFGYV